MRKGGECSRGWGRESRGRDGCGAVAPEAERRSECVRGGANAGMRAEEGGVRAKRELLGGRGSKRESECVRERIDDLSGAKERRAEAGSAVMVGRERGGVGETEGERRERVLEEID